MRVIGMKRQKGWRRAAALGLAGVMALSLAGCGGKGGGGGTGGTTTKTGELPGDAVAMGRYVETMLDVDTGEIKDLKELSDGRLVLLEDGAEGRWVSEDGGATWKPDQLPGWYNLLMDYYVYDMKAAPDGGVAVLCKSYGGMSWASGESEAEDGEEASEAEDETADDTDKNSSHDETGETENKICFIPAQGETQWFDVPASEYEVPACLCLSEDCSSSLE